MCMYAPFILGHQDLPRSSLPFIYLEQNDSGQYNLEHVIPSQDLGFGQNEIYHRSALGNESSVQSILPHHLPRIVSGQYTPIYEVHDPQKSDTVPLPAPDYIGYTSSINTSIRVWYS